MSDQEIESRYQKIKALQDNNGLQTYLAEDISSQQQVVVKKLNLEQVSDWQAVEAFQKEVQTLRSLSHTGIPKLLDSQQTDNAIYLIQEAIAGESLRSRLQKGLLNEDEAFTLAEQLLAVLSYLHGLNPPVIHQDIKPENIMLDLSGQAYLVDFGAVRDISGNNALSIAGTFGYMPPEQAAGRVERASDLYALGVTLIESLSGAPPQSLPQSQDLRLLYHGRVTISERFTQWLDRMVDPVVSQRPIHGSEALAWLGSEGLAEHDGRVLVSYPTAKQTVIDIASRTEKRPLLTLILQSTWRQIAKILIVWVAWLYTVYVLMIFIPHLVGGIDNRNFLVLLTDVLGALNLVGLVSIPVCFAGSEFKALKQDQDMSHQVTLEEGYLHYQSQVYTLAHITQLSFGQEIKGNGWKLARTSMYFKFREGKSLRIPVDLSNAERQLLCHGINTHAQKHLPFETAEQLENSLHIS